MEIEEKVKLFMNEYNLNISDKYVRDDELYIEVSELLDFLCVEKSSLKASEHIHKSGSKIYMNIYGITKILIKCKNYDMIKFIWLNYEFEDIGNYLETIENLTKDNERLAEISKTLSKYVKYTKPNEKILEDEYESDEEDITEIKKLAVQAKKKFTYMTDKKKPRQNKKKEVFSCWHYSLVYALTTEYICKWILLDDICEDNHKKLSYDFYTGTIDIDKFHYEYVWKCDIELSKNKADHLNILFKIANYSYDDVYSIIESLKTFDD